MFGINKPKSDNKKIKKSLLSKTKIHYEKDRDTGYVSPTAGKKQPSYILFIEKTINQIHGYLEETFQALKYIIRSIF